MWNSNRGRCSFLFEVRGTSRDAPADVPAAADADVPAAGPSTPANPGHPVERVGGVPGGHRPDRYDLLSGPYNAQFRQRCVDVRRTLPWAFSTDMDGRFVAVDCCYDGVYSCPGAGGGLLPAESGTVGQNGSGYCGDFCSVQIFDWHSARHIYAVGSGTGSFWARVRRDCRSKLTASSSTRLCGPQAGSCDGLIFDDPVDLSDFAKSLLFFGPYGSRCVVYRRLEG